jgi:phosphate/sulfate permease
MLDKVSRPNSVSDSTTSGAVKAELAMVLISICTEIGVASESRLMPTP